MAILFPSSLLYSILLLIAYSNISISTVPGFDIDLSINHRIYHLNKDGTYTWGQPILISEYYAIFPLLVTNNNDTNVYHYNISIQLDNNNIVNANIDDVINMVVLPPNKIKYLPIVFNCLGIGYSTGNVVFSISDFDDVLVPFNKTCDAGHPLDTLNVLSSPFSLQDVVNKGISTAEYNVNDTSAETIILPKSDFDIFLIYLDNGTSIVKIQVADDSISNSNVFESPTILDTTISSFKISYACSQSKISLVSVTIIPDEFSPTIFNYYKDCRDPSHVIALSPVAIFFLVLFLILFFTFIFACAYRYSVLNARGTAIIPYHDVCTGIWETCSGKSDYEPVSGQFKAPVKNISQNKPAQSVGGTSTFDSYQDI